MKPILMPLIVGLAGTLHPPAYGQRACPGGGGGAAANTTATAGISPFITGSTSLGINPILQQAYMRQLAYRQQQQQAYLQQLSMQQQFFEQQLAQAEARNEKLARKLALRDERRLAEEARRAAARARRSSQTRLALGD